MSTSQQADPLIGRLVDGRYRVRARIARGGMATVYVATDLRLERRVALKVMHGHLSDDTVFQSRFIQEARSAARLSDPHVVAVYDAGELDGRVFIAMQLVDGEDLEGGAGELDEALPGGVDGGAACAVVAAGLQFGHAPDQPGDAVFLPFGRIAG